MMRIGLFWITLFYFVPSLAGTISLVGSPEIELSVNGDQVSISGLQTLNNQGNELSVDVEPELKIGSWLWRGEKKNVASQATKSWTIDEEVSLKDLACPQEDCEDFELPEFGLFLVFLTVHYKDVNGHPFSRVEVKPIQIGNFEFGFPSYLNGSEFSRIMKVTPDEDEFEITLTVKNLTPEKKKIVVRFISSDEIELDESNVVRTLDPSEEIDISVDGRNDSGLGGSNYILFSTVEWEVNGYRYSGVTSSHFRVPLNLRKSYWGWVLFASIVLSLGSLFFVFKPELFRN